MVSDHDRRALYDSFVQTLGERNAETVMELLPPVGWADLARQADITALRAELKGEMAELRGDMAELRGDMAELRGEVRAQLPKLVAANIVSMFGVAGLVLAAARLA